MRLIKALLIDDDEDDYILTKEVFDQLSGYELSWVNTYSKGISSIRKSQFDIYLLDYRLGNGTGIDLLQEAINSGSKRPIIMLTGKGSSKIDQEAMDIGAADYFIKDQLNAALLERSMRYAIKHTEVLNALKSSETKYRTIFEEANDPMMVTDHSGKILELNPAGMRLFGYESASIINRKSRVLFEDKADATTFFGLLEEKGAIHNFECNMQTRSGVVCFCSLSAFISTDMKMVSEVYHTTIKDLSYRKRIEGESVTLGKMSISEDIAKGLGEEVRDPLSTVNLALDELAAEESISANESAQACIEIIKANCDRINQVIKNFISSTETKALNLQNALINAVVDEAIEEAEDLIAGQHVQLTKHLLAEEVEMSLDRVKIKNAILNIVQNATEAIIGFPKAIHISTEIRNGQFQITIDDNGTGIDLNIQDKIFEPFFSTKVRRVGLGLTHAKRVFISHNGNVSYLPLKKGSQFVLQLPITKRE